MIPLFTNILVAIDGSEVSDRALARAVDEARIWNTKIHAIYVVETGLFSSLPNDNTVEIMYQVLEKEGQEKLAQAKSFAATQGVTLTTHMKQGHAGSEIDETLGVDLAPDVDPLPRERLHYDRDLRFLQLPGVFPGKILVELGRGYPGCLDLVNKLQ